MDIYLTVVTAIGLATYLNYPAPPMSDKLLQWNNTGHYTTYQDLNIFFKGRPKYCDDSKPVCSRHGPEPLRLHTAGFFWVKAL